MRQIKFRAWDVSNSKMYESYSTGSNGEWCVNIDYTNNCENADDEHLIQMQFTGLKDANDKEIYEGDIVSLDGNMTADDSFGSLPNGWSFDETDVYAVAWDQDMGGWVLNMDVEPDTAFNAKYLHHARSLLLDEGVKIIGNIYENPELVKS